ncbi:MAG: threonine-phosphate decarboxylase CobD [Pseudomonadota bacterium]
MRDHGGDLDRAIALFGGDPDAWIDLSTGINRIPYPVPDLPPRAWQALPTDAAIRDLVNAARDAYATDAAIVPLAGAQAAIQLFPYLDGPGRAGILSPTYNEHAAALRSAGWAVEPVRSAEDLAGFDLGVVVNPNNPDGQRTNPQLLKDLALPRLVIDESFADADPALSLASAAAHPGRLVLRSFGKFYGLAGLRLGFALSDADTAERLRARAGPWAVSGPSLAIGAAALRDTDWQAATRRRLADDARRLDALAARAGWSLAGGTALFRTYETGDATAAQDGLASHRIWTRRFPYSPTWLRLGLPGESHEWASIEAAFDALRRADR